MTRALIDLFSTLNLLGLSKYLLSPATTNGLYYFKAKILVTLSHLAAKKSNSALEKKKLSVAAFLSGSLKGCDRTFSTWQQ